MSYKPGRAKNYHEKKKKITKENLHIVYEDKQ